MKLKLTYEKLPRISKRDFPLTYNDLTFRPESS